MTNLFVAISITIIQIVIILVLYKIHKTLLHPSVLIQCFFSIQIILALIIFKEYSFDFYGIMWILGALFFFSLGGLFAKIILKNRRETCNKKYKFVIKRDIAKNIMIISIILGSLYFLELLVKNGLSINILFNFETLLEVNNQMAINRYTQNVSVSPISRVFLVFIYFSPLIGGFNINYFQEKRMKFLCILTLIPALLIIATQNTKATWASSIILFISGYLTSAIKQFNGLPKLSFKKIKTIIISSITFLLVIYLSMMLRLGKFDFSIIETINKKFVLYALGHIVAFSSWFTNNIGFIEYSLGLKTFYGIADFIGIADRAQGIYTDYVFWGEWNTNVYSIFRSLLEDFGPYLGIVIMLFYGFVVSYYFYIVKKSEYRYKGLFALSTFYFYVLFVFTSAWSYMSYIMAFILFAFYLRIILIKGKENVVDK